MQNFYYQRGLRKLLTTPTEVRAIPTTEELTMTHVGGQAKEEAGEVARSQSRAFRKKRLADVMRFRGKKLSAAKEQGRRATVIQLGNLALTGVGGYRNIQQAEKQSAMFEEIGKSYEDLKNIQKRYYEQLLLTLHQ